MAEPTVQSGLPKWISDHIERYRENPAEGHMWDASVAGYNAKVPTLLLTTTGRKSGRQLVLPLIYGKTAKGYAIIASKGGAPAHPVWYLNLQANPQVDVQVKDFRFQARARTATGAERAAIWKQMVEIYPPYTDYQKRTQREIPVVVLEPVGG
jgi:deazaflavin-dependent oxidoreductase (nitroreductase family)